MHCLSFPLPTADYIINIAKPLPNTAAELKPPPSFIADRLQLWDQWKRDADAEIAAKPRDPITVTLPDGKQVAGKTWETTPYAVACGISQGLADATVVAKVDGVLWDLDRPLEADCTLQLVKFDDADGKAVFWHSSAHALGEAMERIYGGHLCYGPPIESGFYYDMHSEGDGVSLLLVPQRLSLRVHRAELMQVKLRAFEQRLH